METTKDTGALNKKLAEWARIKTGPLGGCPDFTNSLDACFKWLVPKVKKEIPELKWAMLFVEWLQAVLYDDAEPALALCLAIEKLIDGEASDE